MSSSSSPNNSAASGAHDDAPLPPGWSRGYSRSQKRHFYFHETTKHTQWHFPTASEVADPRMAKKRSEQNARNEAERRRGGSSEKKKEPRHSEASSSSLGQIVPQVLSPVQGSSASSAAASGSRSSSSSRPTKRARTVEDNLAMADSTSVAIIVPYRDLHPTQQRAKHLKEFVPYLSNFLQNLVRRQSVSQYHIYIVEQSDDGRKFNRGKLLNIGFDYAKKQRNRAHDVFIFHDVDLLPGPELGEWYAKFPKVPLHIARVWDRYSNNPKYFGGIVSFSSSDYKRINGYPNTFWGWGGEDDELQKRCERLRIRWEYPAKGSITDLEDMDLSEKLQFLRENKEWKCMVKWEALEEHEQTWRSNGLADLSYSVLSTESLAEHATKVTVDVKLNGNHWANDKCSVDFMGDYSKK